MGSGHSEQGKTMVTLTLVAVVVAAVLATLSSMPGVDRNNASDATASRPPQPLEAPVVKAPPLGRTPTSVVGGPPAQGCEECEPLPVTR